MDDVILSLTISIHLILHQTISVKQMVPHGFERMKLKSL